jgi:hypothetical protein
MEQETSFDVLMFGEDVASRTGLGSWCWFIIFWWLEKKGELCESCFYFISVAGRKFFRARDVNNINAREVKFRGYS